MNEQARKLIGTPIPIKYRIEMTEYMEIERIYDTKSALEQQTL